MSTAAALRDRGKRSRQHRIDRRSEAAFKHGASAYSNWRCRCDVCCSEWERLRRPSAIKWLESVYAQTREHATNHGKEWTDAELDLIRQRADLNARELAEILGRTIHAVRQKRHDLRALAAEAGA